MNWIDCTQRVPDDRRRVLVWGSRHLYLVESPSPRCLGVSRYNPAPDGGSFDIEGVHGRPFPVVTKVTHWCEIVGPVEVPAQPPASD